MTQLGLPFDAPYPSQPGWKRTGTSKAAAEAVKPRALTLREKVLDLLKSKPLTADECADTLGKSPFSIRPRLTELLRMEKIEDTGFTRRNASKVQATVWRAITDPPR